MRPLSSKFLLIAAAAAIAAPVGAVRAGSGIDTTGATLTPGAAPVAGAVTIDARADLGAPPSAAVENGVTEVDPAVWTYSSPFRTTTAGGPAFHATADVVLPGGDHEFGAFVVDAGVTVRFDGPANVRIAQDARIDGVVKFHGPGGSGQSVCTLVCDGDMVITASTGPESAGITTGAADDTAHVWAGVIVRGSLSVSAEPGSTAVLAPKAGSGILRVSVDDRGTTSLADTVLRGGGGYPGALEAAGSLELTRCAIDGDGQLYAVAYGGTLDARACDLADTWLVASRDITVSDATTAAGAHFSVLSVEGRIDIAGDTTVRTARGFNCTAKKGIDIAGGASVRISDPSPDFTALLVYCSGGDIVLGEDAELDAGSAGSLQMISGRGVEIAGRVAGAGGISLQTPTGDITLGGTASLDADEGTVDIRAGGDLSVDGAPTIAGGTVEVRAETGDIGLDGATVTAGGAFVATAEGDVVAAGSVSSGGAIGLTSLREGIDVAGASLRTADTLGAASGSIRLGTYGRRGIDAADASLVTGASDVGSGSISLLVQAPKSARSRSAKTGLRVTGTRTVRTSDGVRTTVRGVIVTAPGTRLDGAVDVTLGSASGRLFLTGGRKRLSASGGGLDLVVKPGSRRAAFVAIADESSAEPGAVAEFSVDRAGLHAGTTFRRLAPK